MEWKKIFEYYYVSNTGLVKREDGYMRRGDGLLRFMKGRFIRGYYNKGYRYVRLQVDNKEKRIGVHQLVAFAFLPNPDKLPVVNHKNGIPSDNNSENLEWCTHAHNSRHSVNILGKRGNQSKRRKIICLTDGREFESTAFAAKALGVSPSNIHNVLRGANKHTGGLVFRYA